MKITNNNIINIKNKILLDKNRNENKILKSLKFIRETESEPSYKIFQNLF
jgi:hypothetical protein